VISPSTFDAFRELRRLSIVGTEKRCARTATRQYLVTYLASNKETQGIELFRFFVSFRAATLHIWGDRNTANFDDGCFTFHQIKNDLFTKFLNAFRFGFTYHIVIRRLLSSQRGR
jgi:hypothetical protein